MKIWTTDPSSDLVAVFDTIARTQTYAVTICNPQLQIEAVSFRRTPGGHWAGAMITPWAINLLCLPGIAETWPVLAASSKHGWQFPSGDYEFTVADEASLGSYHLYPLFSPALEFSSHEAARRTALAAVRALFGEPVGEPPPVAATGRRTFLGRGR